MSGVLGLGVWLAAAFLAGLVTAAPPVGPITSILMRHCVMHRWRRALANVGPAALSNGVYAGLVLFGYESVVRDHPTLAAVLRLGIVLLVFAIGLRFVADPPEVAQREQVASAGEGELVREVVRGTAISLVNPSRLGTWAAALDLASRWLELEPLSSWDRVAVAVSVSLGTASWFLGLIAVWSRTEGEISPRLARGGMRVLGLLLIGLGLAYLGSSWTGLVEAWEAILG